MSVSALNGVVYGSLLFVLAFGWSEAAGSVAAADNSEAFRGLKVATVFGAVTMRAQDNQLALPNYLGCAVPKGGSVMVEVTQSYGADVAVPPAASICKL